jgi:hypothetical protein
MTDPAVLVLGGYGAFGTRVVQLLLQSPGLVVHVAGRRLERAQRACAALGDGTRARPVALDRDSPEALDTFLRGQRPTVVVDASGPFQDRDHSVAARVAGHGIHWIDLADARAYVGGIATLGGYARERGVLVASGASTFPALTVAVVDALLDDLDALESISIGLSPGHRSPRGRATVLSLLRSCGRRVPGVAGGTAVDRPGWGDLRRHRFPSPVGGRWLSNVDLPDLDVLAQRYEGVDDLRVQAGLELSVLHLGLSLASALVRRGWLRSLEPAAGVALRAAALLHPLGSNAGALNVTVRGARGGRRLSRHWTLVAERGDGPCVPAAPASVLVKRLCGLQGYAALAARGAGPCVGLVDLDEILRELAGRAVRVVRSDEVH